MAKIVRKVGDVTEVGEGRYALRDSATGRFWRPEDEEERLAVGTRGADAGVRRMVQQPLGGISLMGIDMGKTTGVAVWDAWDQRWYVDQLDGGGGKRARYKVHAGVVESPAKKDAAKGMGVRLGVGVQVVRGGGSAAVNAVQATVERSVVRVLLDLLLAVGPRTVVVLEDFVSGQAGGQGLPAAALKRDGLSPVRLNSRFQALAEEFGYWNGDAWRDFMGGWWAGADGRGVQVPTHDPCTGQPLEGVPNLKDRLTRVEQIRLAERSVKAGHEVLWGGAGAQLAMRMPAQRLWMRGNAVRHNEWMRERGYWLASAPHGMVAMQHAHAVGRGIGVEDLMKPVRIWESGAKNSIQRVSAKSRCP